MTNHDARGSDEAPVLVVGAGPTGLITAIELLRRGVRCRLIERLPVAHQTSKSFTIHSRTLEMLEHAGVAHRFLETGLRSRGFTFNFLNTKESPTLDFGTLPSRYPFILIYNQNETERVLRQHLEATFGVRPEWGVQLLDLSQVGDSVEATLRLADGTKQVIQPRWVVGADGVRSRVRECSKIAYEGEDYQENILQMMDVGIENFTAGDDWIHYFIAKDHFLLVTKLPGATYRVLISDLGSAQRPSIEETREAFQGYVDGFRSGVRLAEPRWATKWRVLKRLTTSYRQGSVFLAGDSAHCHSPSGGSGMNVCMQDAFNLAWKIALVERGDASRGLLDTYEPERRPVAQQLLEGTHAMHEIIMGHGFALADRLERTRAPGWHDTATRRISGLSYDYRVQLEALRDETLAGPLAGDRVPDADLEPRVRLFDVVRHPGLTLLLAPSNDGEVERSARVRTEVKRTHPSVKIVTVLPAGRTALENDVYTDGNGAMARAWGGSSGFAALLRPDQYVQARAPFARVERAVSAIDALLGRG